MTTKLIPLRDRILVRRIEAKKMTDGGLYIPDNAKEKPTLARVLSVGSGRMLEDGRIVPLLVKEGDQVLFGKYTGSEVTVDDEAGSFEALILREEDVLAIVREGA